DDVEWRSGFQSAVLDCVGILNDAKHAVRVVPTQVCQHQAFGDTCRFIGRHMVGEKERFCESGKFLGAEGWHGVSSLVRMVVSDPHAEREDYTIAVATIG